MVQAPNRTLISDAAWQKVVAREAIIWPIAFEKKLTSPEIGSVSPTGRYQIPYKFWR